MGLADPTTSQHPLEHDAAHAAHLSRHERSRCTRELLETARRTDTPEEHQAVLDRVIELNLRVAEAVASRYSGRGIPTEDLRQAAYEGLTKAVWRFDPAASDDLLTYAVPVIRGHVQRYFRDQGWSVRPPRRLQELQWRINHTIDLLEQQLGREPHRDEVCAEIGITGAEYDEGAQSFGCLNPPSLDQPVGPDSPLSLGGVLSEEDHSEDAADARVVLEPVLRRLSERDRRILYLRFVQDKTQREIGEDVGVTQMQVSRTLTRILGGLRRDITAA